MKKNIFIAISLLLSYTGASAQSDILGDANGDGKLTVADVTTVTDMLLTPSKQTTINTAESFIRENRLTGTYIIDNAEREFNRGYEYVDLGLASNTKWCTANIGALSGKANGTSSSWSGISSLLPTDTWVLPTATQISELWSGCTVTDVTINEVAMLKFTNKSDATKFIYIPKSCGYIWSSTSNTAYKVAKSTASVTRSTAYIRPVIKGQVVDLKENEISTGENNGDLE